VLLKYLAYLTTPMKFIVSYRTKPQGDRHPQTSREEMVIESDCLKAALDKFINKHPFSLIYYIQETL